MTSVIKIWNGFLKSGYMKNCTLGLPKPQMFFYFQYGCALWQFTPEALISLAMLLWQEHLCTPLTAVCTFNAMPSGQDLMTECN